MDCEISAFNAFSEVGSNIYAKQISGIKWISWICPASEIKRRCVIAILQNPIFYRFLDRVYARIIAAKAKVKLSLVNIEQINWIHSSFNAECFNAILALYTWLVSDLRLGLMLFVM